MMACIISGMSTESEAFPQEQPVSTSRKTPTKKGYKTYIQRWIKYYGERKISQVSPSVNQVLEVLTGLFHDGLT